MCNGPWSGRGCNSGEGNGARGHRGGYLGQTLVRSHSVVQVRQHGSSGSPKDGLSEGPARSANAPPAVLAFFLHRSQWPRSIFQGNLT